MDMLIANVILMLLKKGVVGNLNKVEAEFEIPQPDGKGIKVIIKADNMSIKFAKTI